MAARNFTTAGKELQRDTVTLHLRATGGGAAANCTITHGLGVTSVAYNAATGKYTVNLKDVYPALLSARFHVEDPNSTAPWQVQMVTSAVASKTVDIWVYKITPGVDADFTLTDLSTDETLVGTITLLNSANVPLKGS